MNSDFELNELKERINEIAVEFATFNIKNENEFISNEDVIHYSIDSIKAISSLLEFFDDEYLSLQNNKLFDILLALKKYNKKLVSKFGTFNAYKLYDFMTIDLLYLKNNL